MYSLLNVLNLFGLKLFDWIILCSDDSSDSFWLCIVIELFVSCSTAILQLLQMYFCRMYFFK